jgi:hypothetical protein
MFNEHGSFKVELRGNILFLTIVGAWNIETSKAYQQAISEAIKSLVGTQWAVLTFMDDWELCTPDCEPIFVEIILDGIAKGLVKEAVVNNKSTLKLELFSKYQKIKTPNDTNIPFKRHVYQDEKSALAWLVEQGFSPE